MKYWIWIMLGLSFFTLIHKIIYENRVAKRKAKIERELMLRNMAEEQKFYSTLLKDFIEFNRSCDEDLTRCRKGKWIVRTLEGRAACLAALGQC